MKKIMLFIFLILLLSFNVNASTEWTKTGNYQSRYSFSGYELYASPFANSNYGDFLEIDISISPSFRPIVAPQLDDTASENLIYFSVGSILYAYNTDGEIIFDYEFNDTITVRPSIINYEEDNDLELIIIVDEILYLMEINDGYFTIIKNITINKPYESCKFLESYYPVDNTYLACTDSYSRELTIINIDSDTVTHTEIVTDNRKLITSDFNSNLFFTHSLFLDDLDNDNIIDVYIASINQTNIKIYKYILSSTTPTFSKSVSIDFYTPAIIPVDDVNADIEIYPVQIGLQSSQKEIVLSFNVVEGSGAQIGKQYGVIVLDKALNILYSNKDSTNTELANTIGVPYLNVGDINKDGSNELCFMLKEYTVIKNFYCYDRFYNQIMNYTNAVISWVVMGEYDDSNDYLELISNLGMFVFSNSTNYTTEETFDDSKQSTLFYPVTLESRSSYIKDLLMVQDDLIRIYKSDVNIAICGNGVCELGETELSCFSDCQSEALDTVTISNVTINPSPYSTWKNGTTLDITFYVTSSNPLGFVQAKTIFYYGDSNEQLEDYGVKQSSGTMFSFSFPVNKTITDGILRLYARPYLSDRDEILIYNFDVALVGIENDDLILYDLFPSFEETNANATKTVSSVNNIVSTGFAQLSGYSGLSGTILWLILMVCVGVSMVFVFKEDTANLIIALIIIETFLLIIGTLLSFMNPAILITIVIIAVAIIIMKLKNSVTGV